MQPASPVARHALCSSSTPPSPPPQRSLPPAPCSRCRTSRARCMLQACSWDVRLSRASPSFRERSGPATPSKRCVLAWRRPVRQCASLARVLCAGGGAVKNHRTFLATPDSPSARRACLSWTRTRRPTWRRSRPPARMRRGAASAKSALLAPPRTGLRNLPPSRAPRSSCSRSGRSSSPRSREASQRARALWAVRCSCSTASCPRAHHPRTSKTSWT